MSHLASRLPYSPIGITKPPSARIMVVCRGDRWFLRHFTPEFEAPTICDGGA